MLQENSFFEVGEFAGFALHSTQSERQRLQYIGNKQNIGETILNQVLNQFKTLINCGATDQLIHTHTRIF